MEKKLYRNEHDKMIAGVASGLADYMQVEITIVRLLFVLSAIFMAGLGLVAYIVMWIIVPVNNNPAAKFSQFNDYFKNNPSAAGFGNQNPFETAGQTGPPDWTQPLSSTQEKKPFETQPDFSAFKQSNNTGRTIAGLLLIVVGGFFMMKEFDLIPDFLRLRNVWPVILIAVGVSIIAKSRRKNDWQNWQNQQPDPFAPQEPKTTTETNVTDEQITPSPDTNENPINLNKS